MLSDDHKQMLDDGARFLHFRESGMAGALTELLDEFEADALNRLRSYDGHDREEVFNLLRQWKARAEFRMFLTQEVESRIELIHQVSEELGLPVGDIMLRSELHGG